MITWPSPNFFGTFWISRYKKNWRGVFLSLNVQTTNFKIVFFWLILCFHQSGSSRHPGGYSPFHPPMPYTPHTMNYGPFGGPYGGYAPGGQHTQMPGSMQPHPGMIPPGPMLPPRIPTPPLVQPMPIVRSHTPSPETTLPEAPSSNTQEVKSEDTKDKSTAQQGTQTVLPKRRPSSRASSRRSSEDKTETVQQEKKKQETKDKENTSKDSSGTNQAAEPQKQRQGK